MSSGFTTDPQPLITAGRAFGDQVDPINTLATRAEVIQGGPSNAGRHYAAQGSVYHAAMLTFVQALMTPLATKTTWVADTLASTARSYRDRDSAASAGVTGAGQGLS